MPRTIVELVHREEPVLHADQPVGEALRTLLDTGLPALPVVDAGDRYAGIFGERELITGVFPGYVRSLGYAAFVPKSLEAALQKRQSCTAEPVRQHMNREHIDVSSDFSDVHVAEIFINHRVLIVPVTEGGRVRGLITRTDFFRVVAGRLLEG
jgi:CBS domain-containing protein